MSVKDDVLDRLIAIRREFENLEVDSLKQEFGAVESILNKITASSVSLPIDLRCLISMADKLNAMEGLFSGYEIFNIQQFLDIYHSKTVHMNFLLLIGCEEKWGTAEHEITFYKD